MLSSKIEMHVLMYFPNLCPMEGNVNHLHLQQYCRLYQMFTLSVCPQTYLDVFLSSQVGSTT